MHRMGHKTISISDETYLRLADRKGPEESFSDVIDRLLRTDGEGHPLSELIGLLTEEEINRIWASSKAFRRSINDRFEVHGA